LLIANNESFATVVSNQYSHMTLINITLCQV